MKAQGFKTLTGLFWLLIVSTLVCPNGAQAGICDWLFGRSPVDGPVFYDDPKFVEKVVTPRQIRQVRMLTMRIREVCPKNEDCIFIGMGQSPTPVIAMMQAMGESDRAYNLPLSSFRNHPNHPGRELVGVVDPEFPKMHFGSALEPRAEQRLFNHFDLFLPPVEELAGKRIFLVDFGSRNGNSLVAGLRYIQKYYGQRGFNGPIDPVLMTIRGLNAHKNFKGSIPPKNMIVFSPVNRLGEMFLNQDWDNMSAYGSWYAYSTSAAQTHVNQKYSDLVSLMKRQFGYK